MPCPVSMAAGRHHLRRLSRERIAERWHALRPVSPTRKRGTKNPSLARPANERVGLTSSNVPGRHPFQDSVSHDQRVKQDRTEVSEECQEKKVCQNGVRLD